LSQLNDSSPELLDGEAELRKVNLKSDKSNKIKQQGIGSASQSKGIGLSFTSLRAGLRSIHPLDATDSYFDTSGAKEPKLLHLISKKPAASPKGSYILDNYFGEYSTISSAEFSKQQNSSRAVTAPELTLKRKPGIDSTDQSFNQFLQNYEGLLFRDKQERTWGESKSATSLSSFEQFGVSTVDKRPAGKTMNLYRPWSAEFEVGSTTVSKGKATVAGSKMLTSITENISAADDDCVSIDMSVSSNISASSNRSATSTKRKRNKLVVIHNSSDQVLPSDILSTTADLSQQIKVKAQAPPLIGFFTRSSVIGGIGGDKRL
jgi:hypothetical protein